MTPLRAELIALADFTQIYPAHDFAENLCSTIGEEKHSNPRSVGRSRKPYIAFMNDLLLPLPDQNQEALQFNESAIDEHSIKFPTPAQLTEVNQIGPRELYEEVVAGPPPIPVDVSEDDEFTGEFGQIAGAILIALRHLSERAKELDRYKILQIVTICRVGVHSTTASAILISLRFEHVCSLEGGMLDWVEARLPNERASQLASTSSWSK